MIFADKLIYLRKKFSLTKEELAEKLNVSRQSVSKWEGAQSIPDIDKIISISKLFNISVDALIKDDVSFEDVHADFAFENQEKISLEEAQEFISSNNDYAKWISFAVSLCIIAPIPLFILQALKANGKIKEAFANAFGMVILILIIIFSTIIFIVKNMSREKFKHISNDNIVLDYGVEGFVKKLLSENRDKYIKSIALGVAICIISAIPLICSQLFNEADDSLMCFSLSLTLLIVSFGVNILVNAGIIKSSYDKLLQEGDYTKEEKKNNKDIEAIAAIYWPLCVCIYLAYSFITKRWDESWIIWVVSGLIFSAIVGLQKLFRKNK